MSEWRTNTSTGQRFRVKNVLSFTGEPIRPAYNLSRRERSVLEYIESGEAETVDELDNLLQVDTSPAVERLKELGLVEEEERKVRPRNLI